MPPDDASTAPLPIIDSHIHLYAQSHIPSLGWTASLSLDHRLNRRNSIAEYRSATADHSSHLLGFIFVETDRKSGLQDTEWTGPLDEVDFLLQIARGEPVDGEGHSPEDSKLVLGIVPWAPVPASEEALAKYIAQVHQRAGSEWALIKGFRYLVQDKPAGVMLQPNFLSGLECLGKQRITFDLGVDARSGGLHQLEEACEMMNQLYQRGSTLKIIINHLCKPNLRLSTNDAVEGHKDFTTWREYIQTMASHKCTYMKLSGTFSELPGQDELHPTGIDTLVEQTKPWVDVVFAAFGSSRILFGSDWPVCNVGGPGIQNSWNRWYELVEAILTSQNLTREEKIRIYSGTAVEAYNITLGPSQ